MIDLDIENVLYYFLGFLWILVSSHYVAKWFPKYKLPLITGFLFTGIVTGPDVLKLISVEAIENLSPVNDISLAFIAFAAGSELFMKEIRHQLKSIAWNTFSQLVVTFTLSTLAIFYISDSVPFMAEVNTGNKVAISLLMATIFVARSPSSAIAVINELRAKGPFTKIAIGVTVLKDILVIILFTVCFSVAITLTQGQAFRFLDLFILLIELTASFVLGILLGWSINLLLKNKMNTGVKAISVLVLGYGIFLLCDFVRIQIHHAFGFHFYMEPLLICIAGSYFVTNHSRFRPEFQRILEWLSTPVYVAFFTLAGAMLSITALKELWQIALILFFIRLIAMMISAILGSYLAGDPKKFRWIGWMPYVTQAGVAVGLTTKISGEFGSWGLAFSTTMLAVIVLNQVIGPPLFKWALQYLGESHLKAPSPDFDGTRDVAIFGLDQMSLALSRQLNNNRWVSTIYTRKKNEVETSSQDNIEHINDHTALSLNAIDTEKFDAVVFMVSDDENLRLARYFYENVGTKDLIVLLHERTHIEKFNEMGVLIVEPDTAIVGLLDHFVRSPFATSLLLGLDKNQDTIDVEILNQDLHGMALRDLRFPSDIIILSVKRRGQTLISHGYTRLRQGDVMTVVGSIESLDKVRLLAQ